MNWVKVADGLPDDGEDVVAWCGKWVPFWVECKYAGGGFMRFDYETEKYTERLDDVTHWLRIVPPQN